MRPKMILQQDSLLTALMFVFENFIDSDIVFDKPDDVLSEMVKQGFKREQAAQALDWFGLLAELQLERKHNIGQVASDSFRVYLDYEAHKITQAARDFLQQLENNHIIDASLREIIIHLSMALDEPVVDTMEITWVSLMSMYGIEDKKDQLGMLQDMVLFSEEGRPH